MGRGRPGTGVEALATSIRVSFTWQGTRHRETLGLKPTPANIKYATRLVADIKKQIASGTFEYAKFFPGTKHATGGVTFKEFADKWLSLQVLEHSSKLTYKYGLKLWSEEFGDKLLGAITVEDIKRFIARRVDEGIGAKALNNNLDALRGVFAFAVENGDVKVNPTLAVKRLRQQKAEPDPFSKSEMERILMWMEHHAPGEVYAWYTVAFTTGLRPSEQRALRGSDVIGSQLRVERAYVRDHMKGTKTNSVRYVDLSLRAKQKLNSLTSGDEYIFDRDDGAPMTDVDLQRLSARYWAPCLMELGIKHRSPYHTRHTYATVNLMAGVNPGYIARQLGHTSMRLLLSTYSRWLDGADGGVERAKMEAAFVHTASTAEKRTSV
jgi:integrase